MWMMAAGIELAGFNELGVRLFFPPLAILALLAVYLSVSRFYTRRAGLLAITVMATAPVFAIMSRQAVTDGPMVSIMVIGLMFLTQGLFLIPKEEASSRLSRFVVAGVAGFAIGGQLLVMCAMDRSPDIVRAYQQRLADLHFDPPPPPLPDGAPTPARVDCSTARASSSARCSRSGVGRAG